MKKEELEQLSEKLRKANQIQTALKHAQYGIDSIKKTKIYENKEFGDSWNFKFLFEDGVLDNLTVDSIKDLMEIWITELEKKQDRLKTEFEAL